MVVEAERQPQILPKPRPTDPYREVIERYDVAELSAVEPLRDRERVIATLVEQLRPLLDAIVEFEAAEVAVQRCSRTLEQHPGSMLAQVASSRIIRARERRLIASETVKELVRSEQTILRYAMLRHLVRSRPGSAAR
jgi:hypothetical protein